MNKQIKTFKDLLVWQHGMQLTRRMYNVTKNSPLHEQFGLTSQMRRAAVSVPSNIAEGWMKNSPKSFSQFLRISLGSLGELETQLEICSVEGYVSEVEYTEIVMGIEELRKMLFAFHSSLITHH